MSRPFYFPLHPHACRERVSFSRMAMPRIRFSIQASLCFVDRPRSLRGQLRVFYFLHPLVADPCRPTFERFGLGGRDGLDDAEDVFCVGAVNFNP